MSLEKMRFQVKMTPPGAAPGASFPTLFKCIKANFSSPPQEAWKGGGALLPLRIVRGREREREREIENANGRGGPGSSPSPCTGSSSSSSSSSPTLPKKRRRIFWRKGGKKEKRSDSGTGGQGCHNSHVNL